MLLYAYPEGKKMFEADHRTAQVELYSRYGERIASHIDTSLPPRWLERGTAETTQSFEMHEVERHQCASGSSLIERRRGAFEQQHAAALALSNAPA